MLPLPAEIASPTLDTSHATSDGESPFCAVKKRPMATAVAAAEDTSRLLNTAFYILTMWCALTVIASSRDTRAFMGFLLLRDK